MKRLLSFLFIILGLGLTFNVNVNSTESMIYSSEKNLKINEVKEIISTIENEISKLLAEIKKDKDKSKDCKDSRGHSEKCNNIGVLETSKIKKLVSEKEIYEKILKAKISKKEPKKTQKMAKKKESYDLDKIADLISKAKNPEPGTYSFGDNDHIVSRIIANKISTCWSIPFGIPASEKDLIVRVKLLLNYDGSIRKTEILNHSRMNIPGQGFYRVLAESVLRAIKLCAPYKVNTNKSEEILIKVDARNILFGTPSIEDSKSEIAKAEPALIPKKKASKTKVDDDIIYSSGQNIFSQKTSNSDGCFVATENAKLAAIRKLINKKGINSKGVIANVLAMDILNETITKASSSDEQNNKCVVNIAAKIKVEEKQTKVAKVDDSTQEEFKPKKTNQDNEAPVIEIAEAITVNDTSYILEGSVTDKSNKVFLEIDGQPVQVKKGKFKVKRYSPVDEQIKIVAIDQWGNKSKTKLVNITIDIDETIVANKLEPLNPSNISNKSSNNKVALIIGIENYTEAPKANYANLDAKYFFDYARRAFGVNKQNINLLVNEEATVVKTDKAISLWLKSKIKKNKSDLIIFFAGHGLASSDGKELYLLPQDGNPDRLERTALSRTDLFKEIISLNPKSVTMFLDTCYSGVSRDEQMLLASARPIRIVADEQEGIPNNFTIFSASQLDQISSGLKEANHGIFSYFLMKGLEGKADSNQDKKITNGELFAYMDENISQKAAEQGREQNPSLAGDPDKILMSYR